MISELPHSHWENLRYQRNVFIKSDLEENCSVYVHFFTFFPLQHLLSKSVLPKELVNWICLHTHNHIFIFNPVGKKWFFIQFIPFFIKFPIIKHLFFVFHLIKVNYHTLVVTTLIIFLINTTFLVIFICQPIPIYPYLTLHNTYHSSIKLQ